MLKTINGSELAGKILTQVQKQISTSNIRPRLDIVFVGANPASATYIQKKELAGKRVGAEVFVHKFPQLNKSELLNLIQELNSNPQVHGIIIQLPIENLDAETEHEILSQISPQKDVDGLNPLTLGLVWQNHKNTFFPATAQAAINILDHIANSEGVPTIEFYQGKNVLIINRSNIIGKPLAAMLLSRNCTVTIAHSHTSNLEQLSQNADIIISGTGKPDFIQEHMLKEGVILIDSGFTKTATGISGDVNPAKVSNKADWLSPVPGGIGPLGVAVLIENTYLAATKLIQ